MLDAQGVALASVPTSLERTGTDYGDMPILPEKEDRILQDSQAISE